MRTLKLSHSAQNGKGGHFAIFKIHCVAKFQIIEWGPLEDIRKFSKKPNESFEQSHSDKKC